MPADRGAADGGGAKSPAASRTPPRPPRGSPPSSSRAARAVRREPQTWAGVADDGVLTATGTGRTPPSCARRPRRPGATAPAACRGETFAGLRVVQTPRQASEEESEVSEAFGSKMTHQGPACFTGFSRPSAGTTAERRDHLLGRHRALLGARLERALDRFAHVLVRSGRRRSIETMRGSASSRSTSISGSAPRMKARRAS